MPATTQLALTGPTVGDARCALFTSGPQPSDALSAQGWIIWLIREPLAAVSAA